ncbi:UDP-glucosyltransferase 2-like isoform X1 [Drosophila sulfurigaster albostrigata]|uniref:UDP-glucosyltransferase 2-like isoform X1 n=1 Tax=Drosophila sulfurigaster albostrigata TaxID=89887 RepID=UPI002D21C9A5|nr:UDP-glucosyltransferase 2-like isoform X1 [Drosophila sulfurigaster albostrigata]
MSWPNNCCLLILLTICGCCCRWCCCSSGSSGNGSNILMITMGGTKSHKIPFWALGRALIKRGHRITFVNGFQADFHVDGLVEVTPKRLVQYIRNYTDWDLVGARYAGQQPLSIFDAMRYPIEACNSLLSDPATHRLLRRGVRTTTTPTRTATASGTAEEGETDDGEGEEGSHYQLAIVDGAFPECALGIVHSLNVTAFMYINTVAFYTGSLSLAGNPVAYAVTPHVFASWTLPMHIVQRVANCLTHVFADLLHWLCMQRVHHMLRHHLGDAVPHPYVLASEVAFILQNGHFSVTPPSAQLPNVASVACLHCRPPAANLSQLDMELSQFMDAAPAGVIYLSMGSSVRSSRLPAALCQLFVAVFARLPHHHVLWTWAAGNSTTESLPRNVRVRDWLPQQDILGHRRLQLFITHGGLLSQHEAVYHGVPLLMLPVFCDHDANAAQAVHDGYARRLELAQLTEESLYRAIHDVLHNDSYLRAVRRRRALLHDQLASPLRQAVYWTEYVIRHKGARHLQSPARHMSFVSYYSLDVFGLLSGIILLALHLLRVFVKYLAAIWRAKTKKTV